MNDKVCPTCNLRLVNWTPAFDADEDTRCKFCGVPMVLVPTIVDEEESTR